MHMYIRMYAYMYIYIHTYERVHMHMRMHMHVHIHLQSLTHMAYGVVSGCSVSSFWVQQEALTVNPKGLNLVFEGFRVSGPGEIGQARAFMQ